MRNIIPVSTIVSLVVCLLVPTSQLCQADVTTSQASSATPQVNVVLLDQAADFPELDKIRRNDWKEWETRIPSFLRALEQICDHKRGLEATYARDATLFSILLPAKAEERDQQRMIAEELGAIFDTTGRPSCVLSRSTAGRDQLSLVFQDGRDYRPAIAARIIMELARSSPPNCTVLFPNERGPFQPPPSFIMDYRPWGQGTGLAGRERARVRWGVLEEGFLLGQYVLHALSVLDASVRPDTRTFYQESAPGPGTELALGNERTALIICPGVGTDRGGAWKPYVEPLVRAYEGAGKGPFAPPLVLRRIDNLSPEAIHQKVYDYSQKAYGAGTNPVIVLLPHTTFWGYVSPVASAKRNVDEDLAFGKTAVPALLSANAQAAQTTGVSMKVIAHQHSFGASVFTQGLLAAAGRGKLVDQMFVNNGRVNVEDIGRLSQTGIVAPGGLNLLTNRGDLPASIGSSASNWEALCTSARSNPLINAYLVGRIGMGHSILFRQPVAEARVNAILGGKETVVNGTVQDLWTGKPLATFSALPDTKVAKPCLCYEPTRVGRTGGILFAVGNRYTMDASSGAWRLLGESRHAGSGATTSRPSASAKKTVGIPMTRPGWVPTLDVGQVNMAAHDLVGRPLSALPVGVPRLYSRVLDRQPAVVHSWTSEVCQIKTSSDSTVQYPLDNQAVVGAPEAVLLDERETGSVLPYRMPFWSVPVVSENDVLLWYEGAESQFQPDLAIHRDGSFSLVLRHGTVIRFDTAGRLISATDRLGRRVEIGREEGRIVEIRCPDGQVLTMRYTGGLLSTAERGSQAIVRYHYEKGCLSRVENGVHIQEFRYDSRGFLSQVLVDQSLVSGLTIDLQGRLVEFAVGGQEAIINYQDLTTAAVLSEKNGPSLIWKFGPRTNWLGVIHADKKVLLFTRDRENRMIQMAFGWLVEQGGETEYAIEETVGVSK